MKRLDVVKRYGGIFFLAVAVIIFYKLFDSLGIFVDAFKFLLSAFTPVVIGSILAYFLYPIAKFIEKKFKKRKGFLHNHRRVLSVLITFFSFILIIILALFYLIPILTDTVVNLMNLINTYLQEFDTNAANIITDESMLRFVSEIQNEAINFMQNLVFTNPMAHIGSVFSVASTLITWVLGLVFCPYILIERDSLHSLFNRICLLFMPQKKLDIVHTYCLKCHKIFGGFVYGKFIDASIIASIALIGFSIIGLKFFPLLALVVLITDMIPYFGPFIGGIPIILFAFLSSGLVPAIWTAIFILCLQQFDGLIMGPAILGETVGISPFWVIFSITVFGRMFGFIGMFLGVPLICIIRMFFNDYIAYRKKKAQNLTLEEV